MTNLPQLTNCPVASQAPFANYNTGNLSGFIQLWVR